MVHTPVRPQPDSEDHLQLGGLFPCTPWTQSGCGCPRRSLQESRKGRWPCLVPFHRGEEEADHNEQASLGKKEPDSSTALRTSQSTSAAVPWAMTRADAQQDRVKDRGAGI